MKPLEKSIVHTLAYFDIFAYPLTAEELYRFLWLPKKRISYEQFHEKLSRMVQEEDWIETAQGYYFLQGKRNHIAQREEKIRYVEQKMRIARRAANVFRFIPYFRAMFVCNQLPVGVTKESDIDVFIVMKKDRLWISRLLTTLCAAIFGLRRSKRRVRDHICLSFYVTDDAINLKPVRIEEAPDVYLAYWLTQLIPVYDPTDLRKDILARNTWMHDMLPYARGDYKLNDRWRVDDIRVSRMVKRFFEIAWKGPYGDLINTQAKGVQEKRMRFNQESKQFDEDNRVDVVVNDHMLKFHENDRRRLFQKQWKDRLDQTLQNNNEA